jgi:hypothetical protein
MCPCWNEPIGVREVWGAPSAPLAQNTTASAKNGRRPVCNKPILCTMRSGPARLGHRVRFTTEPALVSGRSRNLSRFAIPSGSGCA